MAAPLKYKEVGFIRTNKHELHKVIGKLTKESEAIIDRLLELSQSKDEKMAHDACKTLMDVLERFAKVRDQDELQRLVANIKFGGPKQLEEDDDTPTVDFTVISSVK